MDRTEVLSQVRTQLREATVSVQIVPATSCFAVDFAVVKRAATCLRALYEMPGTDVAYGGTDSDA
eukprot:946109-Rhodomonas_salina.1